MKICYKNFNFASSTHEIINTANEIITSYESQGYDLTLRQLYYQFVSRGHLENTEKNYKRLGSIINDARLAGLIDWNAITDRTRSLRGNSHWSSPAQIVKAAVNSYKIDTWQNQRCRVEVWIEKDALVGVISEICQRLDVNYFSCRGYVSQSEMWGAAMRLLKYQNDGQSTIVIHLGDHDPSGMDMTRDIQDRLNLFGVAVIVNRIALNMPQIEELRPPPNPAKLTDSRCSGYIKRYGKKSWELDALEPSYLTNIVDVEVLKYRNDDLWNEMQEKEDSERQKLSDMARKLL